MIQGKPTFWYKNINIKVFKPLHKDDLKGNKKLNLSQNILKVSCETGYLVQIWTRAS